MAGRGSPQFFASGFATVNTSTRTRVLLRQLQQAGLEVVLDWIGLQLPETGTAGIDLLFELAVNGATLATGTIKTGAASKYLSLPFLRFQAVGQLEVFFTHAGANQSGVATLSGRYVPPGTPAL
jgi:hypothetical protein